ncbi:MAG TPA: type II toxin-antitoxin system RelE/ParE family toxin [Allosphingosinicella sp.]
MPRPHKHRRLYRRAQSGGCGEPGPAIEACAERLPDHPFLYRPGRAPGTREAVVHPNCILAYRVTGEAVEVVNLVHARQRYP